MKHEAGNHSQMYCKSRFTHSLCTGYRTENSTTLSQVGIDFPKSEGRIEILCSCTCHRGVKKIILASDDPGRYGKAQSYTIAFFDKNFD